jgi:hypothetical protein
MTLSLRGASREALVVKRKKARDRVVAGLRGPKGSVSEPD